ncbi:glycine dehydrogenase (aminomethyl-transferring) [Sphingorhabdus lutea]|uniref:Probable glycine dehydrogenase (decarboxylating) subunit 1 n=1 Tax=Sphingorhabdus lutea TaxID=1913578 RepID=A0A1L3JCW9_9SPHN|nr:aminomethyl-transferring glycine dehydrogenase subunit GcvPA [Sphingorhabdus lutea]APG62962.1 glycine dehydrogenase (aminomethyl-transferring) [Sphingorhabdus lutea]
MRYLPLNHDDRRAMLNEIGVNSIDDLFIDVPKEAQLSGAIEGLNDHISEMAVERHFHGLANKNMVAGQGPFFLGAGAYRHHVPASVDHIIQRGEFLTAYTPYQPEIAQGTLQMLFEFQTQVARLFGTDVANASMYDGSTACWEAISMAGRITKRKNVILSGGLHPHYVSVASTMARFTKDILDIGMPDENGDADMARLLSSVNKETSAVVVQYPDIVGNVQDLRALSASCAENGALLIVVVTEPVALGAVTSPGEMGADIVVGEGQSIGVGLQFGGPYVGLFGCKSKYVRQMPGRLCGETVDAEGKRGFVLTLSTREQHIRRDKATSNICTNSGLCALAFSIHMTLLGEKGLRHLAMLNHQKAVSLADKLHALDGVEVLTKQFFNEFAVKLNKPSRAVLHELAEQGILGGVSMERLYPGKDALENIMLVAVTETSTDEDMTRFVSVLKELVA